MYEICLANRLSHAWIHSVTDLASLLTDHRMSGRPIRAKYKHFKTICEQTSDDSPTDSSSSCLNWWSSRQGLKNFVQLLHFLVCQIAVPLDAFLSMSLHVVGPRYQFFHTPVFFQSSWWVTMQVSFKRYHGIFNVCPWFSATVSWKTYPYVWTFWLRIFWAIWEHPPILLEKRQILHQLLVRHNLVILQ